MARLSTGKRINSAADDAAGVAIASRLSSEIRGTDQAIRNALDGQALIDTAEGGHKEIEEILQRMREVAIQSANDTNSSQDRGNLQAEMDALTTEIDRIAGVTTWAGNSVMDGGSAGTTKTFSLQVGAATGAKNQIAVAIGAMDATTLGVSVAASTTASTVVSGHTIDGVITNGKQTITLTTSVVATVAGEAMTATADAATLAKEINENDTLIGAGVSAVVTTDGKVEISYGSSHGHLQSSKAAMDVVKNVDAAMLTVGTQRSELGAISNRLTHTVSNMTNVSTNLSAARGGIEDADFALETTNLAKNQILQQASTAMLAQANASKQNVLSLLQ
jgi:flagellin